MNFKKINTLALSLLLLTACSSKKVEKENIESNINLGIQSASTTQDRYGVSGDFGNNYKLVNFIERMVSEHHFDKTSLIELFSKARNTTCLPCITYAKKRRSQPSTPSRTGAWDRYRNMFIYEKNIQRGLAFWEEHANTLNRAYHQYGVLPEYIVGIIGIETAYGVNFGKSKVIDVLTTKSMFNDRREAFYTKQLEKFLIMTRDAGLDPSELMGSSAGAMGYGQFIASSYLDFAVDFDNDGVIDLWNPVDAIGSIANYFHKNGWKRSLRDVAIRAKYKGTRFKKLETGYKTKYSQYTLRKKFNIIPREQLRFNGQVSLIKLPMYSYDELWFGTHNFRVITTYNHSTLYGMAVHQLAKTVKERRYEH
ncbi:lytic murein transglycosylase B [bacterium]|nr:lytic murein transglycosylase B [bacterium]MBU1958776.1 lytic murein transglycosylase B [bacterium]